MTTTRRLTVIAAACALLLGIALLVPSTRARLWGIFTRIRGRQTVESVLADVGPAARARLKSTAHAPVLPGSTLTLLALKQEKTLHVFATPPGGKPALIKSYPILAASGGPGPKTREGDNQVPEGLYRVESLNPNSAFHLALRLDYPNDEDRRAAKEEGRDVATLGGDIMIHGKSSSIGCLAMGDEAIEEIFTLIADAGVTRASVVIAPCDLRTTQARDPRPWVNTRYEAIRQAFLSLTPSPMVQPRPQAPVPPA